MFRWITPFIGLFLSNLCQSDEYVDIGLPVTQIYDMDAHLGGNQNWWLIQGENGLIYNATGVGLNEWDGENWAIYKTPNQSLIRSETQWTDGRIYVGTMNDIGYYQANNKGIKQYHSLLENWTFEQRQFGDIWSVASNSQGVMFMSSDVLLFWDGHKVSLVKGAQLGKHRLFSIDDQFYYKTTANTYLKSITISPSTNPSFSISTSKLQLPKGAILRQLFYNNASHLVAITDKQGIFEAINNQFQLRTPFEAFKQPKLHLYNGIQAHDGYYYLVSLTHGLFILNESFQVVKQYTENDNLGTNTLLSVMEDRQGNIWLSGVPSIIKMIPPHIYSQYKTENNAKILEQINRYHNKPIVAGLGVHLLTTNDPLLAPATFKKIDNFQGISWDAIEYKDYLVYAGTGGVYAAKPNLSSSNRSAITQPIPIQLVNASWAKGLAIDPISGDLFSATYDGLYRIRYREGKWSNQLVPGTNDDLHFIAISDQGIIWVGTPTQELYRIENAQFDNQPTSIQKFKDIDGLGANNIIPFKVSSGIIFGTNDGVMNFDVNRTPKIQFVHSYPKIFQTKNNDVYRMVEDKFNRIWYRVSGLTGYIKKDEQDVWQIHKNIFAPFDGRSYTGFSSIKKDIIWFTKSDGQIYRLNLTNIRQQPPKGILNIRKITNLDNNSILFGGSGIPHLSNLDQQHNSIRFYFALAENTISNRVEYRHRLVGSSKGKWSVWSRENTKDYTSLKGANYVFEVEAKDGWGNISANHVAFIVLPPWYLTTLAKYSYFLLGLGLLILTAWLSQRLKAKTLHKRNKQLENQVMLRTQEVQHKAQLLEQEKELKEHFFSNVSHEFRTPLTLTLAPLDAILYEYPNADKKIIGYVSTAIKNAKKMLALVSQILDINRLDAKQFQLHIDEYDISNLINRLVLRFKPLAEQNNQKLLSSHSNNPQLLYMDLNQIDRCLSNLISNAIKYSGEGSEINLSIVKSTSKIGILVCDNGKGIPSDQQHKIFERFYQGSDTAHSIQPGTGIGLSLVKDLVALHHGTIELTEPHGHGCCFTIWLKQGFTHFNTSQMLDKQPLTEPETEHSEEELLLPQNSVNNADMTTLLIVDDNSELRHFISLRLSGFYKIVEAENGKQGFEMAKSCLPDLIISDVMMPVMDGLELTRSIKSHPLTASIPIILLTAKSSKRHTVEGLENGADDYLVKPFDTSELFARVNGIITRNKSLKHYLEKELSIERIQLDTKATFKQRIEEAITDQLSNAEFTIEQLASLLAMSRVTLNRKCNKELSMTASQYITNMRMTFALKLLKEKKYNISEIAFASGFASLNYFTRSFKKHFGDNPTSMVFNSQPLDKV